MDLLDSPIRERKKGNWDWIRGSVTTPNHSTEGTESFVVIRGWKLAGKVLECPAVPMVCMVVWQDCVGVGSLWMISHCGCQGWDVT